jgi:4'-phosphopantetheinyl transferase
MTPAFEISWPLPPADWHLGPHDVHIWAAALDRPSTQFSAFSNTLSADEQARASRFHFERDRNRFIVGRGWLRALLGQYLDCAPAQLRFDYGNRGKPALSGPLKPGSLHFNLAHSDGLALLAVTHLCSVGVDVEQIRPLTDAESIAERFFSPQESAGFKASPTCQQPTAFFNLWTRKEAWLKATGKGIADSLDQVEVSFLPGQPAQFLRLFGNSKTAQQWGLVELAPANGFIGALALPALDAQVHCWRWPH